YIIKKPNEEKFSEDELNDIKNLLKKYGCILNVLTRTHILFTGILNEELSNRLSNYELKDF
ncbi:MAG: hypothetical protein QXQ02_10195, partial [Halobacteria archaeon]